MRLDNSAGGIYLWPTGGGIVLYPKGLTDVDIGGVGRRTHVMGQAQFDNQTTITGESTQNQALQVNTATGQTGINVDSTGTTAIGIKSTNDHYIAMYGITDNGTGVDGTAWTSGIGVAAYGKTGFGVYSISEDGPGVYSSSLTSNGVQAASASGTGISAYSSEGKAAIFSVLPADNSTETTIADWKKQTTRTGG